MFSLRKVFQFMNDGRDLHEIGARSHNAQKADHAHTPAALASEKFFGLGRFFWISR
jgi:hypothetical protein